MPGQSFDHVADIYDATRGGTARGDQFADAIAHWLLGPRTVELGIGTGVVAAGLRRRGIAVSGVDISEEMMRAAIPRLGSVVALADVDELPFASDSLDSVLFVWVLQLVDDPVATLQEAARVVRPGGRVVTIAADPEHDPDDEIGAIIQGLDALKRPGRTGASIVAATPPSLGLQHSGFMPWQEFTGSTADQIDLIERRSYSTLFHVDDQAWATVVEPVLDRLRALPDPARSRSRRNRHPLIVWRKEPHDPPH